jgi:oxygen-independent coproporphyrinogen-3 oxidase
MPIEKLSGAGLYIHIPFCTSVCPYCDFAVLIAGAERREGFLSALDSEAALYADHGFEFDTVYLGGGTPSSLTSRQLEAVLEVVRRNLVIRSGAGIYLEVNPEDVNKDSVRSWRDLGFTVVSVGVQSFDNVVLGFLGRRHTAETAGNAVRLIQRGGFDTVSIDLIYGLDGQTGDHWRGQLAKAAAFSPDHLSCYQLTMHPGTVFGRRLQAGRIREQSEDCQAVLFRLTHEVLADAGYEGYEISNFAAERNHRSRHNLKYWTHTPYLGLGPSAHSFDGRRRWWNRRKLRLWQRALEGVDPPAEGEEILSDEEMAFEAVMLGLRTTDGVDLEELLRTYGVDLLTDNLRTIEKLEYDGRVVLEGERLRPTTAGLAIADTLARNLMVRPSGGGKHRERVSPQIE